MFRKIASALAVAALSLTSIAAVASTASATEVEPTSSHAVVTVESRTVAGKVTLAVRAQNTGASAVDIDLVTPYGSKSFDNVAAGSNAYQTFSTRQVNVDSVSVTVVVDDVSVVVNHTSLATSVNLDTENRSLDGTPALAVRAQNTGASAVDIDLVTPYGSKSFDNVAAGSNAYQTFVVR